MARKKSEKLVSERVDRLFRLAENSFGSHPERSHRYAELICKLSMRTNFRLPKNIKRRICDKCRKFLVTGKNSRVRTSDQQQSVIVTCLECGHVMRYPYREEKSKFNKNRSVNNK